MDGYLTAPVPRAIRVRPTLMVAGNRLPVRGTLTVVGIWLGGMLLVFAGADLERALWLTGGASLLGLGIAEGKLWNRTVPELVVILWQFVRRPRRWVLQPIYRMLPPETSVPGTTTMRRPRWQTANTSLAAPIAEPATPEPLS